MLYHGFSQAFRRERIGRAYGRPENSGQRARMKKEQGPHFLCIGPERTGTTWLYRNLRKHPQVSLPHIKEFRYFNWHYSKVNSDGFAGRFFNRKLLASVSFRDRMRRRMRYYLKKNIRMKRNDFSSLRVDLKYWFGRRSDRWYLSFFRTSAGVITGDISPQYCRLDEEVVGHIKEILPDLKIILLLRDPIDRVWSNAKLILSKQNNEDPAEIGEAEYYGFFDKEYRRTGGYTKILSRWQGVFPRYPVRMGSPVPPARYG